MVGFTASNIVAMIFFIPLLLAVGMVLAFIAPKLAITVATIGIVFAAIYILARVGFLKRQLAQRNEELTGMKKKRGKKAPKAHKI